MPAVEIIITVTLPLVVTLLFFQIRLYIEEKEGRRYDRELRSMLRDHLLRARDALVGMESRGTNIDHPDLNLFRPSEQSDWLASEDEPTDIPPNIDGARSPPPPTHPAL